MTVYEFADELLPVGTELILRWTNKPKQKVDRPRKVFKRRINVPDGGSGLYLTRPDGKVTLVKWPKDHCIEITDSGFAFWKDGKRYVEYDFTKEELGDGLD